MYSVRRGDGNSHGRVTGKDISDPASAGQICVGF